jgi:hypothetical protein
MLTLENIILCPHSINMIPQYSPIMIGITLPIPLFNCSLRGVRGKRASWRLLSMDGYGPGTLSSGTGTRVPSDLVGDGRIGGQERGE